MRFGEHPIQINTKRKRLLDRYQDTKTIIYHPLVLEQPIVQSLLKRKMFPTMFGTNVSTHEPLGWYRPTHEMYQRGRIVSFLSAITNETAWYTESKYVSMGDDLPFCMVLSNRALIMKWFGTGLNGQRASGGPNHLEHVWHTNKTTWYWVNLEKPTLDWRLCKQHNPTGPSKVINYKTAEYTKNGKDMTLTEFKKDYLITHLEVYNKPADLVELCNR